MSGVEQQLTRTAGGPISYRASGAGPALLLMHGIGGNSRSWHHQLKMLASRFRVVAWDAPGYGASGVREPTLAGYAGAVADLFDALDIGKAHVLGHSMGGLIAQGVAGLMPERVDRLILSSTFAGDAAIGPLGAHWMARLDDLRRMMPKDFGQARAAAMVAASAAPEIRAMAAAIAAEVTQQGLLGGCMLLHHADARPLVARFSMPVLVITGAEDSIIAPERTEVMAELIADCRTIRIPATGHAAYLEDPDRYNAAVTDFLNG